MEQLSGTDRQYTKQRYETTQTEECECDVTSQHVETNCDVCSTLHLSHTQGAPYTR